MNIKSLALRSISGIVYVAIIVGCIYAGQTAVEILGAVFAVLATLEFYKITHAKQDSEQENRDGSKISPKCAKLTLIIDVLIVLCVVLALPLGYYSLMMIPFLLCRCITEIYSRSESPLRNVGLSMMSYFYIAMPLSLMLFLIDMYGSAYSLLVIFIMIWLNDTGAFIVGSALGKHSLFPRVSPKKSWEGFFGGLIFNIALAILWSLFFTSPFDISLNLYEWIGFAIVVTVFATYGDLFESLYKRSLGIKDSGNLIPGHGGILDRIDSLLFVIPATFFYLFCILLFK
ncbi:MAG: phosphatidate cytidylyltransferase [Muribaculaceae bacterium]|nr:phosphatidate cytidylyltransferase [Muribaculaceae bacterium]